MTDGGTKLAIGAVVGAALLVALIAAGADAGWWVPDTFGGDLPTVESGLVTSSGAKPEPMDPHEADLVWTLEVGGRAGTEMSVSEDDQPAPVYALAGDVHLDADGCPATVAWAITPHGAAAMTFPPLTDAAPDSAALTQLRLPGSPGIHLELWRLDSADCAVDVRWSDASFRDSEEDLLPRQPARP